MYDFHSYLLTDLLYSSKMDFKIMFQMSRKKMFYKVDAYPENKYTSDVWSSSSKISAEWKAVTIMIREGRAVMCHLIVWQKRC
jgi:hypothetical protein